jgi:hypothetical protein
VLNWVSTEGAGRNSPTWSSFPTSAPPSPPTSSSWAWPNDLLGRDPYALYDELCRLTKWCHAREVFKGGRSAVRLSESRTPSGCVYLGHSPEQ